MAERAADQARITDGQIEIWLALAEAATPGPWETHQNGSLRICHPLPTHDRGCESVAESEILRRELHVARADAAFIAAAREALPAALRELRAAREAVRATGPWVYSMGVKAGIPYNDSPQSAEWQALLLRIADALPPTE